MILMYIIICLPKMSHWCCKTLLLLVFVEIVKDRSEHNIDREKLLPSDFLPKALMIFYENNKFKRR